MTEQQLRAAELVAKGKLSIPKIAEELEVSPRTIDAWKAEKEFQEEVAKLVGAWREGVRTRGIADKDRRLENLNGLQRRTVAFMEHRAKAMVQSLKAEAKRLYAEADAYAKRDFKDEWEKQALIDAAALSRQKADSLMASLPMVRTGMARMELKSLHTGEKSYEVVQEWYYDHQLAAEIRAQMEQAAIEQGQWKSKVEHTGADGRPIETSLTVTFIDPKPEEPTPTE